MKTREEKKWELMRQVLAAEATGKSPQPVVSKRTLFGIPSSVDQAIAAIAAEEDARCERLMRQKNKQDGEGEGQTTPQSSDEGGQTP